MLDFARDIQPYLTLDANNVPPAKLRHAFYQASIDHRNHLRDVFGKAYPTYLDMSRPKEREEYRNYRRRIYKNPLRSLRRRVIEVLDYIRQADDFSVSFDESKKSDNADSLEAYLTDTNYSKDGTAENWFFKNIRKKYVNDPNAVLVILPTQQPESDSVRARPQALVINCDEVYQYRKGEFAVLESPERSWLQTPDGPKKIGKVLLFLDHDSYCIATQTATKPSSEGDASVTNWWTITGMAPLQNEAGESLGFAFQALPHYCPVMPAIKLGKLQEDLAEYEITPIANGLGTTIKSSASSTDIGEEYFESILADSLPHIKSAQGIQSDIEVERNFHVSSQEWRYSQKRCPDSIAVGGKCDDGKLFLTDSSGIPTGKTVACPTCKGTGHDVSGSGLGYIIVSAPQATSLSDEGRPTNLPTPPGGFIPRSIDPLKEFVLEYEREKKQAYETINMQFLMETPIDQSGTAKRVDREELYRTLIVEGVHLCNLFAFQMLCTAYQRRQEGETPTVLAPVRLSIENSELTRAELEQAVGKGFDLNLRKPLEKKLIEYQAGKDSDYYMRYELRERLDDFADLSFEEKLFLLSSARITVDV